MIGNGVVVHRYLQQAAVQERKQPGELQQFSEPAFQGIGTLREGATLQVPKGLILQAGEQSLTSLEERPGVGCRPHENRTEHLAGATPGTRKPKYLLTSLRCLGKHFSSRHRPLRRNRLVL